MIWINSRTREAEKIYRKQWHKWFAWIPVIIDTTGEGAEKREIKAWLRYVERRGTYFASYPVDGWWIWEYREAP